MNNEIENEQPTMNNAQNNPEGGISLNPNNNEQIGIEIDTASQNIQNAMSNNSTTISQQQLIWLVKTLTLIKMIVLKNLKVKKA